MLGGVSAEQLAGIVAESMGNSPVPQMADEGARRRAMSVAREQGVLDRIGAGLAEGEPIAALPYNLFREFRRTGNRSHCEQFLARRREQIDLAATAVWLGMAEKAAYLRDLLWAECEQSWWVMPAHEAHRGRIDLRVAMLGYQYALLAKALGEALGDEVVERIVAEVRRRVLDMFFVTDPPNWWRPFSNNWNAVCHGGVVGAAMLIETDPAALTRIIASALTDLEYFLDGFTADGGCTEGPSYWRYGFSWYARLAAGLYDFTGGRVNIMDDPRIEPICRYPLAMSVAPGRDVDFADVHRGYLSPATAIHINRFVDVPELFGLCQLTDEGHLEVAGLEDLALYQDGTYEPLDDPADYHLAELGVAKLCAGATTLGAKAGNNAEHHNHNDVGSLIVHRGTSFFLTDPGAPVYSARTFSDRRYESIFCNSFGHGVPVINGQGQGEGEQYAGTLEVEGLNGGAAKTLRIEMAGAYDVPALKRLTREIELPAGGGQVLLADSFSFAGPPKSLEEVFITTCPAEVGEGGKAVTIRSEADGSAELRAVDADGTFAVAELAEESAAEARAGELLRRITFTPAALAEQMTLRFALRLP